MDDGKGQTPEVRTEKFQVKELGLVVGRLEVCLGENVMRGHIKLDGQEVRGVRRLVVEVAVGEVPVVTMELIAVGPG